MEFDDVKRFSAYVRPNWHSEYITVKVDFFPRRVSKSEILDFLLRIGVKLGISHLNFPFSEFYSRKGASTLPVRTCKKMRFMDKCTSVHDQFKTVHVLKLCWVCSFEQIYLYISHNFIEDMKRLFERKLLELLKRAGYCSVCFSYSFLNSLK